MFENLKNFLGLKKAKLKIAFNKVAVNDLSNIFTVNRKRYLNFIRQDTFTGIPEFELIISQIKCFKAGYKFGMNPNFFGVSSKLLLDDGREVTTLSGFFKQQNKATYPSIIHCYVTMDFLENSYLSGINFELTGDKIGVKGNNEKHFSYDFITHIKSPKYSSQTENNFYFEKRWVGKAFIKSEKEYSGYYKNSGLFVLNVNPVDKNLYENNGKFYLVKYSQYGQHSNLTNSFALVSNLMLQKQNCDILVLDDNSQFNNKTSYQEFNEIFEKNKDKVIYYPKIHEKTVRAGELIF